MESNVRAVTAHFEFSGAFWVLFVLLVLGGFAIAYRKELALLFDRLEQQTVKSTSS